MPRHRDDPRVRVVQDHYRSDCVMLFAFNTFCRIPHTHLAEVADALIDFAENLEDQP
ncbi:hypothetical protein [Gordonia polyisoprenivorans]|uniref:hypothetical protein n=1 Tax=Gordonia polyisoprenivorans TaxID=84595 RepID=UPI0003A27494|nr:hypothetical protein [Gordonia polyisoprenivorans]